MDLIRRIPEISDDCGEDVSDWHALSAIYQEQLHSHDCTDLVHLIKSVYLKNRTNAENGRRPYKVDQEYQKRAEELLHSELAAALDIPMEQVAGFIAAELEKKCSVTYHTAKPRLNFRAGVLFCGILLLRVGGIISSAYRWRWQSDRHR